MYAIYIYMYLYLSLSHTLSLSFFLYIIRASIDTRKSPSCGFLRLQVPMARGTEDGEPSLRCGNPQK